MSEFGLVDVPFGNYLSCPTAMTSRGRLHWLYRPLSRDPGCVRGPQSSTLSPAGGPYGAVGVDLAFEAMLCQIFGDDFIQSFKAKRPAAWVDLTIAFEARKRTVAPGRANALNISLPFSFIDYYKRHRGQSVEAALRRSK